MKLLAPCTRLVEQANVFVTLLQTPPKKRLVVKEGVPKAAVLAAAVGPSVQGATATRCSFGTHPKEE